MTTLDSKGGTLIGVVAKRIRDAIVAGELPPGSRLVISELIGRLNVSPMPVREALRRLEGEGLVEAIPNRGATVRRLDTELVSNIYDIRACLEMMVVAQSAENMTFADLREIDALQEHYETAVAEVRMETVMEYNRRLHERINSLGGNPEACVLLERGTELIAALRARFGFAPSRLKDAIEEHRALLDALRRGDGPGAAGLIRMHTVAAKKDMLERLSSVPRFTGTGKKQ